MAGSSSSSNTRVWIERLVWILIYGGLLAASLGLFILRGGDELLGWFLIGKGGIAAAAGTVLIWVRSRMT
ncbi:hypothetical protein G8A07_20085 [Roseateles sp. DAIF2]|uniref:hypothetical protein n=1 Tax=Roseateles sp. DAIF2 TaxID=2714952 RepID=UPI0018A28D1A|nr:hypothetical protein [Roseateles sp. DAIF2]QPF74988.1 hypothetical protein G8A07_20085 [Roseateles sp. DAIF2]